MKSFEPELERLRAEHLYRRRATLESPQGAHVRIGSETLLSFCSNDYLALANDPRVVAAFKRGADRYGVGAGASHLVSGHTRAHHALEEELAAFVGAERALVFSTGFMANLGVVTALTGRHDVIAEDRLNHASLIDAARLARAKVMRYPHADAGALARVAAERPPALITSDAVFSMDGDVAPVPELLAVARAHGARLLLDDAHGLGVLGARGRGTLAQFAVPAAPPVILMGTLGKALGAFGAFVAGEAALIETLIQRARSYIYTTALPAAVAEAVRASLKIAAEEEWRRERLRDCIMRFRAGAAQLGFALTTSMTGSREGARNAGVAPAPSTIGSSRGARDTDVALAPSPTPIQPLIVGESARALAFATALRRRAMLVPAIRPPTVPAGAARLRITFSAAHETSHVDRLLEALREIQCAS